MVFFSPTKNRSHLLRHHAPEVLIHISRTFRADADAPHAGIDIYEVLHGNGYLFILLLSTEKAFWNNAESFMVSSISLNLHTGMVNVSSFSGTSGRADGSSIPRKHRRPPFLFSFTANVTAAAHPEANWVVTASGELLS